jgi:hypothetical protein
VPPFLILITDKPSNADVVTSAVCSLDFTRKPEPSTNSEFEIQVVSQRLEDLEQDPWAEDLESASESGSE